MFKRVILAAAVCALVGVSHGMSDGNPNPGVLPINSRAFGTTYADLALRWAQWGLEIPADVNPILDETGEFAAEGQSGQVWFLAGNFGNDESDPEDRTTRNIMVPHGKALFFPIVAYQGWAPCDGETEEEVRGLANFVIDHTTMLECSIDGVALNDLFSYRQESPVGVLGPNDMTGDPPCGVPEGTDILLADGYWLLLAPMSTGEHVVHFTGEVYIEEFGFLFWLDVTYNIIVGDE